MLGYFGPQGTFTHQALIAMGGPSDSRPYQSVIATLAAVRSGEISGGVVPIENSVEGGVSATLDYLAAPDLAPLQIMQEALIEVSFELATRPGTRLSDIRRVITHPHAAAQCRTWLLEHLPAAVITEHGSTAAAAREVANPDSSYDAAICAPIARELYGLEALERGIADNSAAVTRFVLVTLPGAAPERTGHDKTTLVAYMRADRSGALLEILQQLAVRGVNMCRIESRPTKTTLGSYCFSIDAEGHIDDPRIAETMIGLHRICQDVVYLGSYPRADGIAPNILDGATDADYEAAESWLHSLNNGPELPPSL